ncbi:hypothetical protein Nepgr_004864 [Nepenthes gracilis]|uniref:Protein kinase domain-containing protein n=1 Tax=Nepenthes gracilis TaxID=150966 RepID=A0AAD3S258_NEPGR|nr:hypothetical protein Nepgr_004864 [Nepenthes gracilis]
MGGKAKNKRLFAFTDSGNLMVSLGKKRKGLKVLVNGWKYPSVTIDWSHLSLEDYSRVRKKCKEDVVVEATFPSKSGVSGVVTAPPCGSLSSDPPGRGLKRKIGCIDSATRMGRKKKIEQDYDLGGTIGHGKFGSVVVCRSKASGEELACKTLRKGEELVHREVEIMQHLSGHFGIVTLKAVYEDSESFYLVMELCSGGRLIDQMAREGQYSEHRTANIIKELILVIKYCHEMGVVHRDIKPENILLTSSGSMKLADFGLAVRIMRGQSLSGLAGSPAYVAPEVLVGTYSEKVDIWSAGVLLYALLLGVLPFQGDSLEAIFESIKSMNLDFESGLWTSVSLPARDLVSRMLTRDVSARLSADEVLRHPWILFITNPPLKTLTWKSKLRKNSRMTYQLSAVESVSESESDQVATTPLSVSDNLVHVLSSSSSAPFKEQESGLVDALAVAISCMNISEPKRMRLCSPTISIPQECSSNLKANLCTAF